MTSLSPDHQVPARIALSLNDLQRALVSYLAERLPHRTLDEILDGVFARGLAVLVAEEREKQGRVIESQSHAAPHLRVRADKIPFAKPKYRPPSPIPDGVTVRFDDELRDRLEHLLLSNQGSSLESLVETALRRGVQQMQEAGALDPAKVFEERPQTATAAERRRARRRALCRIAVGR